MCRWLLGPKRSIRYRLVHHHIFGTTLALCGLPHILATRRDQHAQNRPKTHALRALNAPPAPEVEAHLSLYVLLGE